MICKNCGTTIKEDDLFCSGCGAPQDRLIRLVISGDQGAFEQLYNYSCQNVYWTIHSMAKLDDETIYDLMQNAYLKAYQSLPQLKDSAAFSGWIKRIAQNETLDYLRKSSKKNVIFFSDMTSDDSDVEEYDMKDESVESNPEASMEYEDRSRLLNEILDEIPEEQRVVLSMYYMQEMSIKEIADELGVSESTVKSRMSYGRKKVEKSVLDLEKKGISLLGFTAMGFFTWLLTGISSEAAAEIPDSVLQGVQGGIIGSSVASASVPEGFTGGMKNEAAGSVTKMVAKEVGKQAVRTAGKVGAARIAAGVIAVVVIGIGAGAVIYNSVNGDRNSENTEIVFEAEEPLYEPETVAERQETESETETESEIETETETESEIETESETETELTVSLTDEDVIMDTIRALGYEYIGGNSYDVLYQGGSAYTENAGMEQEPPIGVASYAVEDLDGDGEEELLLVILEETERVYDTSGKQDSRLAFTVCENRDGAWAESQHLSQLTSYQSDNQRNIMSIADLLPCISTYLVPSDGGMHILIDNPFFGSFSADNFWETIEISYSETEMSGIVYGSGTDWTDEEIEIVSGLDSEMQSDDSLLISRIYIPDFYDDNYQFDWNAFSPLQMGQDVSVTLVLEDFKDINDMEDSTEGTEREQFEETVSDGLLIIYEDEEQTEAKSSDLNESSSKDIYEMAVACYQNGSYEEAQEYFNMLDAEADEDCVKNMPAEVKEAYKEIYEQRLEEYLNADPDVFQYEWDYFLTDIDKDGISELILQNGYAGGYVYTYKDGEAKELGTFNSYWLSFFYDPRGNGMTVRMCHMNEEEIFTLSIKDEGIELTSWREEDRKNIPVEEYMDLPYLLNSHVSLDEDYNLYFDLDDLS